MTGWQEIILRFNRIDYSTPIPNPNAATIVVVWPAVPCTVTQRNAQFGVGRTTTQDIVVGPRRRR